MARSCALFGNYGAAKIPLAVYPHMLRHGIGFKLANEGEDRRSIAGFLGHVNMQNTQIYTDMAPDRYKDFGRGW